MKRYSDKGDIMRFLFLLAFFCYVIRSLTMAQGINCETTEINTLIKKAEPLPDSLLSEPGFGFALLVGIDHYNSSNLILNDLQAPVREIYTLKKILTDNNYVVKILINAQATRQNIEYWLLCLGEKAHVSDRILFYFAGHGGNFCDLASSMDFSTREKYKEKVGQCSGVNNIKDKEKDELVLCLYQPDYSNALKEVAFIDELTKWIAESDAHQQIVWIDACYSGNMNKIFRLPLNFYSYRLLNDGFFALTGIKDKVHDGQYGNFMLQGLCGAADDTLAGNSDGRISLYELSVYTDNLLRKTIVDSSGIIYKSRYILVGSGEIFLTRCRKEE